MKERLLHILDDTACLTRKQMKDYLAGTMLPEEIHAAEAHIASCPLCNMALEGFEAHNGEALEAIASLNSGFLKEHFDAITPQIHLNSLSPATTISPTRTKKKTKTISLSRLAAVAAVALLAVGTFWLYRINQQENKSGLIAQRETAPVPATAMPQTVRIADSVLPQPATYSRTNSPAIDEPAPFIKEKAAPEVLAKNEDRSANMADERQAEEKEYAPLVQAAPPAKPAAAPPAGQSARYSYNTSTAKFKEDASRPAPTTITADKLEKSPMTNQTDMASLSAQSHQPRNGGAVSLGGGRSTSTTYVMDGEELKKGKAKSKDEDHLREGDDNFGAGKYSAALKNYRAEINASSGQRKSIASVMAARCYINLGQKAKAQELLQQVVNDGSGAQRRQAKRLLKELRKDDRE